MKRLFHINCTPWVRQLENFSSGCSSGFLALGQWLLASVLALFAGINRCLPHGVPMRANASVGNLRLFGNGAGALKLPLSIWRVYPAWNLDLPDFGIFWMGDGLQ